jgi:hypothetical protein
MNNHIQITTSITALSLASHTGMSCEGFLTDLAAERGAATLHRKPLVRLGLSDPGTGRLLRELLLADEGQLSSMSKPRWPHRGQQVDYPMWVTSAAV